jgi:hypothetical protein
MEHTKGPWQVRHSDSKQAFNVVGTRLGGKYKIARCPYETDDKYEEAAANARLIAAAPEMVEMLKNLRKHDWGFNGIFWKKIDLIIAKIEGHAK